MILHLLFSMVLLLVNHPSYAQTLSARGAHTHYICNDGTTSTLYSWGKNSTGQLADATNSNRNIPTVASNGTGYVAVGGGQNHVLALKNDGTLWASGDNAYGQLGNNSTTNSNVLVQVQNLTNVIAMAGGDRHAIALKNDGTVWGWGNNFFGTVGDGTTIERHVPVQVTSLSGIIAIAAGDVHSMALKNNGTVYVWGNNSWGQIGNGTTVNALTPTLIGNGFTGIIAIAAGGAHSLMIKDDGAGTGTGSVWAWGANWYGQLGNGTTTNSYAPTQITSLSQVTAIAGGGGHSLFLKSNATLWSVGVNNTGQLGIGSTTNQHIPVQVTTNVAAIAAADDHSLIQKTTTELYAFGYNMSGELGDGTNTNRHNPAMVSSFCVTVLPIELLYFTGKVVKKINHDDSVMLSWATATETNNHFFTLERSKEGVVFDEAGRVDGAGNSSSMNEYSFEDTSPLPGHSYYRLKQTDYDGKTSYSKLVLISRDAEISFNLYPNPSTDFIHLNFSAGISTGVFEHELLITDALGRAVLSQTLTGDSHRIDVSAWKSGIYYYQVQNQGSKKSGVWVKE